MKFLYSVCLYMLIQSLSAQIIFEKNLSDAFAKAKKERKMVFVKYYNSDCPICKKLDVLFEDKKLSAYYNGNFVNYALNTKEITEEESKLLKDANLNFTSVPYLLFFDYGRNFCHYSYTQQDADFLLEVAQNALKPSEQTVNLENKYKAGDRSIRTLYAYNNFLQVQKQDDLARVVAKDLYDNYPKQNLASKKSFTITKDCVTDVDNGFFQFWISNMDKATEFHTLEKIKSELGEIVSKSIYYPNRTAWSLEKISKVKSYILLTELSKNPDNFFWQEESKVLITLKREKDALSIGQKIFEAETELTSKLFTLQHFVELCEEKNSIKNLQKWLNSLTMAKAEIQEQADYYYIELLCFQKLGNKQEFQKAYKNTKAYYQKHKIDTQSIDALKI